MLCLSVGPENDERRGKTDVKEQLLTRLHAIMFPEGLRTNPFNYFTVMSFPSSFRILTVESPIRADMLLISTYIFELR